VPSSMQARTKISPPSPGSTRPGIGLRSSTRTRRTLQNSEEAFVYEQAAFANISDYAYSIEELRVDVLGDVAIATFYLTYSGMFVNDYSFEGSPVRSKTRATMVLERTPKGWKVAHEHFSRFPEPSPQGKRGLQA